MAMDFSGMAEKMRGCWVIDLDAGDPSHFLA